MNTNDKIKPLCAAIAKHEDWHSLTTHLLMYVQPASGIEALRNAIAMIDVIGQDADGEFQKTKANKKQTQQETIIDPDLQDL